ncbi:MAG: HD family hydrolase [Parvibaculaceae bacterium]|nr:HD family hydrolase [Parvibaculaceae bacterium]
MAVSRRPAKEEKPRAWQRMLSGRRLDLLDPSPLDIEIEDIAHGLARVARWNGQTSGEHAYTVAEHCVLVDDICVRFKPGWPKRWRLAALLHDAPEYVIGDMISPFKAALGIDYKGFEERLALEIRRRFGLPDRLPAQVEDLIKRADRASAFLEATQIAGFGDSEAAAIFSRPRGLAPIRIEPLPTPAAQQQYLERFRLLTSESPRVSTAP